VLPNKKKSLLRYTHNYLENFEVKSKLTYEKISHYFFQTKGKR